MNLISAGDLDDRDYVSKFIKGARELSKGELVVARREMCYNFKKTTLKSSKNCVTFTLDDPTISI